MEFSVIAILLILLGAMAAYVPVYMSLFFTGVLGFILFAPDPQTLMLAQSFFKSMDNFALVVVLFFILCGNIMTAGSIVEKLIKVVNTLVSWLPGGLGMAGCLGCGLFGAISGSTVATVVALGGFMIPALIRNGYDEKYSRRPDDDLAQPGDHHPAQHQHDPLLHDHQCVSAGALSDGIHPGRLHHGVDLHLHLLALPAPAARWCGCPYPVSGRCWPFSKRASGLSCCR